MNSEFAATLRREILTKGAAVLEGPESRKLYMIHSTALAVTGQGILFALEGGGVHFWKYADPTEPPLNVYRLISAGFPITTAQAILEVAQGLGVAVHEFAALPPPSAARNRR